MTVVVIFRNGQYDGLKSRKSPMTIVYALVHFLLLDLESSHSFPSRVFYRLYFNVSQHTPNVYENLYSELRVSLYNVIDAPRGPHFHRYKTNITYNPKPVDPYTGHRQCHYTPEAIENSHYTVNTC